MRVPQINVLGSFRLGNSAKKVQIAHNSLSKKSGGLDTVSFSSTARYIKQYSTLPEEIKSILSPGDAIRMFRDIDVLAQGKMKAHKVVQSNFAQMYKNPWLKDYELIIMSKAEQEKAPENIKKYIQSSVWSNNSNIYFVPKSA